MNRTGNDISIETKKQITISSSRALLSLLLFSILYLSSHVSYAQVQSEVDTTAIRIGEQINYKIKVEADSTALVVFPEGQTFLPLEAVEALETDTTKKESKFLLSKLYKLTQFDSGSYTIPRQKIIVGDNTFYTDSLRVNVSSIEIDTTKQKLYDIKPLIDVEKPSGNWWKWLLGILLALALVGFLLYWLIWRKKPLTEEEEIALLPAYDRAKLELKKLDESQYLMRSEIKEYYSILTMVIRKYLDEKVYDRSLESTTDELVNRLQLLKEGNQVPLKKDTIKNIESILKRADLVKFAKSAPDKALIEMDRVTIEKEIDSVKGSLPEPSEEERLLDQAYQEEQERKKKRKKVVLTVAISIVLILATFVGFGLKYGFGYVKDTIVGHESKELLEGNWVESAYGFPPVWIETPKVLKRTEVKIPATSNENVKTTTFRYGSLLDIFSVTVNNTTLKVPNQQSQQSSEESKEPTFDLLKISEEVLKRFEDQGATDILVKREPITTPNGGEGLKTFGSLNLNTPNAVGNIETKYALVFFSNENVLQQIIITWPMNDDYADTTVERIIDSIEVVPDEAVNEE